MDRRQLLLVAVLSITCCAYAQQGQHTVVAMVVGKANQKLPEIKVNGVKMRLPEPQALVQGPPSGSPTYIVGNKASDGNPPAMAAALVMPSAPKPRTVHEKIMDDLQLTKEEKDKLFPCDDYQPYCKNYALTGQCRDVWTQKNCRKSCKLCEIPYGVFIGCQDLEVCKKFVSTACMVRWVRETCKHKCGQCGYERQGNSHIVMGKKRHFPVAKPKKADKTNDKAKKAKALKKMTTKGKDQLRKTVKVQKIKEETPKKTDQVRTNDKPETVKLKPKDAVDEKAVPKDEEDDSEESGEEPKIVGEKSDENDDDDDENDEASSEHDDDDDSEPDQASSGSPEDEDEDEDDNSKASGNDSPLHSSEPIKMDADPRGEPVVAKMVHQPIKFNDAPGKNVKIVKPGKKVEKVEKKKTSKKVINDKAAKKGKH